MLDLLIKNAEVFDGTGLSLTPGFVDAHTHSDTQLYQNPSRWDKLKQGMTTEIGGQCGWSPGPCGSADFVGQKSGKRK